MAEADGELVGSCRAIEEPRREDWAIIELDAAEGPMATEIRYALLQALVEEAAGRNVARFHAACSDVPENMELFGQLGFMAYAQEEIYYRPPEAESGARSWLRGVFGRERQRPPGRGGPAPGPAAGRRARRLAPLRPVVACHPAGHRSHRGLPGIGLGVGGPRGRGAAQQPEPAASFLRGQRVAPARGSSAPVASPSTAAAARGRTTCGSSSARATDGASFLRSVLEAMGSEALAAGILSPVRTYESTGLRTAAATGFEPVGRVTLLVRDVRALVRQPAMVPAI